MIPEDRDERHAFDVVIAEFADGILTADIVVLVPDVSTDDVQRGDRGRERLPR